MWNYLKEFHLRAESVEYFSSKFINITTFLANTGLHCIHEEHKVVNYVHLRKHTFNHYLLFGDSPQRAIQVFVQMS